MAFDEPFDAVVGRFVLLFCPDPVATGAAGAGAPPRGRGDRLSGTRLGGLPFCAESPLWTRCVDWCNEAFQRSGADPTWA